MSGGEAESSLVFSEPQPTASPAPKRIGEEIGGVVVPNAETSPRAVSTEKAEATPRPFDSMMSPTVEKLPPRALPRRASMVSFKTPNPVLPPENSFGEFVASDGGSPSASPHRRAATDVVPPLPPAAPLDESAHVAKKEILPHDETYSSRVQPALSEKRTQNAKNEMTAQDLERKFSANIRAVSPTTQPITTGEVAPAPQAAASVPPQVNSDVGIVANGSFASINSTPRSSDTPRNRVVPSVPSSRFKDVVKHAVEQEARRKEQERLQAELAALNEVRATAAKERLQMDATRDEIRLLRSSVEKDAENLQSAKLEVERARQQLADEQLSVRAEERSVRLEKVKIAEEFQRIEHEKQLLAGERQALDEVRKSIQTETQNLELERVRIEVEKKRLEKLQEEAAVPSLQRLAFWRGADPSAAYPSVPSPVRDSFHRIDPLVVRNLIKNSPNGATFGYEPPAIVPNYFAVEGEAQHVKENIESVEYRARAEALECYRTASTAPSVLQIEHSTSRSASQVKTDEPSRSVSQAKRDKSIDPTEVRPSSTAPVRELTSPSQRQIAYRKGEEVVSDAPDVKDSAGADDEYVDIEAVKPTFRLFSPSSRRRY